VPDTSLPIGAIVVATGSGGVVADVRGVHGEAPEVELDLKRQVLELRGGVKLSRGQGWLQADKATIVDPLNLADLIRTMTESIENFETKVDYILSESNGRTMLAL
jgi:lipopolysaccharide export system protein LptA